MDLNRVFTQRSAFNYVLVIEWLEPDDSRTGMMLVEHLMRSGINSVYAGVETSEGFRAVIQEALTRLPQWGIPAIHIETHGQEPPDDLEKDVLFGSGDGPLLTWSELGILLAPLNQAADFKLMLVGAACHGGAAMGAMNACDHVAPFSLCIGYETKVLDDSIIKSMTELYSGFLVRRENSHTVLARAQEMLRPGEKFHYLTSVILAYQVFRWCVEDLNKRAGEIPPKLRDNYKQRLFEAWDIWFPRELQASDDTFRLDWSIVTAPQPTDAQLAAAMAAVGAPTKTGGGRIRVALLGDNKPSPEEQ
jgi:hypothetical protein